MCMCRYVYIYLCIHIYICIWVDCAFCQVVLQTSCGTHYTFICFVQQCGTNNVVPHATTNNARAFVRDVLFFVTTVWTSVDLSSDISWDDWCCQTHCLLTWGWGHLDCAFRHAVLGHDTAVFQHMFGVRSCVLSLVCNLPDL